jgi:hypothetical protein
MSSFPGEGNGPPRGSWSPFATHAWRGARRPAATRRPERAYFDRENTATAIRPAPLRAVTSTL